MTKLEWAEKLEKIAGAIGHTVYEHETEMGRRGDRQRKVMWDDADYLRKLAKELKVEYYEEALEQAKAS